uniref:Cyclin dependent kinase 4 n=1 Tax=Pelodiscus sinensis TaxID=13735 RepID=K7GEA7_PELSI
RLMDVCATARAERETKVTLVFEHVDQDLKTYLDKAPAPGLPAEKIKVRGKLRPAPRLPPRECCRERGSHKERGRLGRAWGVRTGSLGSARTQGFPLPCSGSLLRLLMCQTRSLPAAPSWFSSARRRAPIPAGVQLFFPLPCSMIGLPAEDDWPLDVALPHCAFTARSPQPVERFVPELEQLGAQLLLEMLTFNPYQRISAFSALHHLYLQDRGPAD